MANGQQKAQQNIDAFEVWKATMSDDDFKQILYRGQLHRGEVAKGIGCGKAALNQNPGLKKALQALEDDLRQRDVLPPLTKSAKANNDKAKPYDNKVNKQLLDSRRLALLEAENIELKAENKELKAILEAKDKSLERFKDLSDTLFEMGLMPR